MPKKTTSKSWLDVKMLIAAVSITSTLALWNLFAAKAVQTSDTLTSEVPAPPSVATDTVISQGELGFFGKILLGGAAPQPQVITRSGGGGRGSQPFTQTRSSR